MRDLTTPRRGQLTVVCTESPVFVWILAHAMLSRKVTNLLSTNIAGGNLHSVFPNRSSNHRQH